MLEGQVAFRRSWRRGKSTTVIATTFLQARCPQPCPCFSSFLTLGAGPLTHLLSGVPRLLAFQPLLSPPARSRLVSQSGLWDLLSWREQK